MKAFIYTGGSILPEGITERPKAGDLCIAADSGYRHAQTLGVRVDVLLGDFDSLGEPKNVDERTEILRVPVEKDFTDTQLAVETAIRRGADDIVIIGGLGGRLDHTLSNLAILEDLSARGIYALITDGQCRARYLANTSMLIAKSGFRYLSLLAASERVRGVSVEGCHYPLKNATLTRNAQYAVSNEITENCALISVKRGALYVIESRDT